LIGLRDWENFERGKFWQYILAEYDLWLEDIRNELEDGGGTKTDKVLHRLGGNAEALRNCKAIVSNIIDVLKAEEEDEDE